MTDAPSDDRHGFVTGKPEHCFACYRLIKAGLGTFFSCVAACSGATRHP